MEVQLRQIVKKVGATIKTWLDEVQSLKTISFQNSFEGIQGFSFLPEFRFGL